MGAIVAERKKTSTPSPLSTIASLLTDASTIGTAMNGTKSTVKTSGSTKTEGLDISKEGVDKVLSDILSGVQGLAEVTSGQKRAGLYNSSVNQQLTNDLTSRTAGEAAKLQAKNVTTTTPISQTTQTAPQADLATTALLSAAGVLGKNIFDSVFDSGAGEVVNNVASSAVGSTAADFFSSGSDSLFGGIDFLGDAGAGFPVFGTASKLLSGEPEDALASGAGYLLGNSILPGVGGIIGSLATEILPIDDIFGGIEDVASGLFGGIGDVIGGLFGGSVVCTELYSQGLMSKYYYTVDVLYARKFMEERTLNGYRYWGIPLVKLMRKSPLVTKIVAWFAVARAHYVVSQFSDGFYQEKLARRGYWINKIGVPICNLIAAVTTPKDYSVLYVRKAG